MQIFTRFASKRTRAERGKTDGNTCLRYKRKTEIISAFFALCMALARAWLAILRLFGVDEDRLVRRYPLLKKREKRASLEESLDALKAADPSFAERESSIDVERISEKTATVVEELEIGDESEAEENKD